MPSRRVQRLASRIRFLVASILQRDLSDPRLGFITVLNVEPTEDLREAKVFYSVLGDAGVKSRTRHAVDDATGFIQREVGQKLRVRFTPRLRFVLDDTQDRLAKVEELIDQAVREDETARRDRSAEPDDRD